MAEYEEAARTAMRLINSKAPRTVTLAAVAEAERLAPPGSKGRWTSTLKSLKEGKEIRSKVEQEGA
jgi:hypothetical protein